jgi:hypothetical protein
MRVAKHRTVAIPRLEKTYENVGGRVTLTLPRIVALNLSSIHLWKPLNLSTRLPIFRIFIHLLPWHPFLNYRDAVNLLILHELEHRIHHGI